MSITLDEAIATFNRVVDWVEARCMAVDGPVTPTLKEMREDELAELWRAVQAIRTALSRSGEAVAWGELRNAFKAAEYQPGDSPVVPVKIAAFMDRVRAMISAAPPHLSPPATVPEEPTEAVAWQHKLTGIIRADKPSLGLHEDYTALYAAPPAPASQPFPPVADIGVLPSDNSDYVRLVVEPKHGARAEYRISIGATDVLFHELAAMSGYDAPASQERVKALKEGGGWFKLGGDSHLNNPCATDGCLNGASWRLEAHGVGANYCHNCAAAIRSDPPEDPTHD